MSGVFGAICRLRCCCRCNRRATESNPRTSHQVHSNEAMCTSVDDIQPRIDSESDPGPLKQGQRVKALYDFDPLQDGDLGFKCGDIMEVVNCDGADWWQARHLKTNKTGIIPSTYVTVNSAKKESQMWWFCVNRQEAETLLMLPGNRRGTYLVRPSRDGRSSVLSLRNCEASNPGRNHVDGKSPGLDIKHYRIKNRNDQFYIIQRSRFTTLTQLVAHYETAADGLCHRLVAICPRRPELVPFKQLEVNRSEIRLESKLGQGKFGEVWKGKWREKLDVAVKQLFPGRMTPDAFLREAQILHKLRHRRLVLLMGVCTINEPIYMIMELVAHGALDRYLKSDGGKTIKFPRLVDFSLQVAEGMEFVEDKMCIHRDLRSANILVDEGETLKIADLGLARLLANDTDVYETDNGNFPVKWTAPEGIFSQQFTIKSDVWSFGILMYEIVTYARMPYPGMSNRETTDAIQNGYLMPNPGTTRHVFCPDKYYDIMKSCWQYEPSDRPSFKQLRRTLDEYSAEQYSVEDDDDIGE